MLWPSLRNSNIGLEARFNVKLTQMWWPVAVHITGTSKTNIFTSLLVKMWGLHVGQSSYKNLANHCHTTGCADHQSLQSWNMSHSWLYQEITLTNLFAFYFYFKNILNLSFDRHINTEQHRAYLEPLEEQMMPLLNLMYKHPEGSGSPFKCFWLVFSSAFLTVYSST